MKKYYCSLYIFILSLAFSGLAYGQYFEQAQETNTSSGSTEFFNQSSPDYANPNGGSATGNNPNEDNPVGSEPDYGEDGPGNPGPRVPIDDWLFLLPFAGMALGFYYLRQKSKTTV